MYVYTYAYSFILTCTFSYVYVNIHVMSNQLPYQQVESNQKKGEKKEPKPTHIERARNNAREPHDRGRESGREQEKQSKQQ